MLIVRAAKRSDLDALVRLAEEAGTGFTSLAVPPDVLEERLAKSERAFSGPGDRQTEDTYQLMLEDTETGRIVGCSAVKALGKFCSKVFDKLLTHHPKVTCTVTW